MRVSGLGISAAALLGLTPALVQPAMAQAPPEGVITSTTSISRTQTITTQSVNVPV